MLDDRKLRVLYAIINSYISTAEPIGSRTISKYHDLGVSSATIRNEMSDLEELGFLNKTHTSSGRVPSEKAYRLYVDSLLSFEKEHELNTHKEYLKKALERHTKEIEQVIQSSAKLLSELTSYTAIALTPQYIDRKLKQINLIQLGDGKLVLVFVSESGVIRHQVLYTDILLTQDQLLMINNIFNMNISNKSLPELIESIKARLIGDYIEYKDMLEGILESIESISSQLCQNELFADGIYKLFNFPEYKDLDRLKPIINFIEDKDKVIEMLLQEHLFNGISIRIGSESLYTPVKDLSIITASYIGKGDTKGQIGVIGPTRMDYKEVLRTLSALTENLSELLNE